MAMRARQLLLDVEAGRQEVILEDVILAEVVWTLRSLYRKSKVEIAAMLEPIIGLPGVINADKHALLHSLSLFSRWNVDFADALLAAKALAGGDNLVCSFDRDFDRIPGVKRVEPA